MSDKTPSKQPAVGFANVEKGSPRLFAPTAAETQQRLDEQKRKKLGGVSGAIARISDRVRRIEETRISSRFTAEIQRYFDHQRDTDDLVDAMEGTFVTNC